MSRDQSVSRWGKQQESPAYWALQPDCTHTQCSRGPVARSGGDQAQRQRHAAHPEMQTLLQTHPWMKRPWHHVSRDETNVYASSGSNFTSLEHKAASELGRAFQRAY